MGWNQIFSDIRNQICFVYLQFLWHTDSHVIKVSFFVRVWIAAAIIAAHAQAATSALIPLIHLTFLRHYVCVKPSLNNYFWLICTLCSILFNSAWYHIWTTYRGRKEAFHKIRYRSKKLYIKSRPPTPTVCERCCCVTASEGNKSEGVIVLTFPWLDVAGF